MAAEVHMMENKPVVLDYQKPTPKARRASPWPGAVAGTLLLIYLGMLAFLPFLADDKHRYPANRAICQSNLAQIMKACWMYANDHGGRFPNSLTEVVIVQGLPWKVLVCPSSNDTPAAGQTTQAILADLAKGGHCSYIYVGTGLTTAASSNTVVAYEPLTNHTNQEGMHVAFADGHVQWVPADNAAAILDQVKAGKSPVIYPPPQPTTAP